MTFLYQKKIIPANSYTKQNDFMKSIHQIFYSCNKFDNATQLENLNKYMLTSQSYLVLKNLVKKEEPAVEIIKGNLENPHIFITNISHVNANPMCEPIIKDPSASSDNSLFYPQKENSLFWCVYIACYGLDEFHMIGSRYQNRELDEKQKIIQFIKQNPKKLKESNHKVTNIMIQELLSALMIQKMASLQDCIAYSIFYNKRIYVVKNAMYFIYRSTEIEIYSCENTIVIYCKNDKEYGLDLEVNEKKIDHIVNAKIRIFNAEKPLKSLSEYKIPDLEKMAVILGIPTHGKKKELYDSILEKCNWNI
jgi:hypothetical protein